jgi:hypothetical protein
MGIGAANIIFVIHLLTVLFVVLTPFIGTQDAMFLDFMFMSGILVHWIGSDSTCCLTVLEQYLRGETDPEQTFMGKIMGPVYTFGNHKFVTQLGLFLLMMLTLYRLDGSTLSKIMTVWSRTTS